MPIVNDQKNMWGKDIDPQRSDLWRIDMSNVIAGLQEREILRWSGVNPEHFAQSVSIPEVGVNAEVTKRDSIPYQMPSYDEPTGAITMVFILDVGKNIPGTSEIYRLMESWRTLVRAGRGAVGNEDSITLDSNYRVDFQFNVAVELLAGDNPAFGAQIRLLRSTYFILQNAWLSKMKVSDLSYEGKSLTTLTVTLFADAVVEQLASQQITRNRGGVPGSI